MTDYEIEKFIEQCEEIAKQCAAREAAINNQLKEVQNENIN